MENSSTQESEKVARAWAENRGTIYAGADQGPDAGRVADSGAAYEIAMAEEEKGAAIPKAVEWRLEEEAKKGVVEGEQKQMREYMKFLLKEDERLGGGAFIQKKDPLGRNLLILHHTPQKTGDIPKDKLTGRLLVVSDGGVFDISTWKVTYHNGDDDVINKMDWAEIGAALSGESFRIMKPGNSKDIRLVGVDAAVSLEQVKKINMYSQPHREWFESAVKESRVKGQAEKDAKKGVQ